MKLGQIVVVTRPFLSIMLQSFSSLENKPLPDVDSTGTTSRYSCSLKKRFTGQLQKTIKNIAKPSHRWRISGDLLCLLYDMGTCLRMCGKIRIIKRNRLPLRSINS